MTVRRYDMRIPTTIKVKVCGEDRDGNAFEQTACTVNVSRSGARIDGIGCLNSAQTIELRRGWFRKARFRVIWSGLPGTPQAGQVGVRLIDSDSSFWGIPFPSSQVQSEYVPPGGKPAVAQTGPIPVDWSATKAVAATPWNSGPSAHGEGTFQPESDVVSLTWQAPATGSGKTIRERVAAVAVRWVASDGQSREESSAVARVLRDKSCIVPMRTALREGTEVTIVNTRTKAERAALVSMCGPQLPDNSYPIAIDLPAPDTAFWGSGSLH